MKWVVGGTVGASVAVPSVVWLRIAQNAVSQGTGTKNHVDSQSVVLIDTACRQVIPHLRLMVRWCRPQVAVHQRRCRPACSPSSDQKLV